MELRQAKDLAKSYYRTFYLDLSPNRIGFLGGIALISTLLFLLFLTSSAYLHFHKIREAALYIFILTLIFEIISILLLALTRELQTRENIRNNKTLLPELTEFEASKVQEYKKKWIEVNFKIAHCEFSSLCESIESAYNKQLELRNKADGKFSGLLRRFFAFPRDRVLSLLLAYTSIIIAILGSKSFSLEKFFEFYGDISRYLAFSANISLLLAAIIFLIILIATPLHLMINCIWQSIFNSSSCTQMTLYIFLRDCHQLASIRQKAGAQ